MRRRLLTIGLVGIVSVLATLAIPLAAVYARQQQDAHAIRELAAAQIAARELTVAVEARMPSTISQSLALRAGPNRAMVVLLGDGAVAGELGTSWTQLDAATQALAADALRGRAAQSPTDALLPRHPLVTAVPVSQGEETVGAVVSIASVDETRERIVSRWLLLAALAALVIGLYVAIALPITRWLIRPIDDLTDAALRGGSRPRPRVGTTTGPPELRRLAHAFNEMSDSVERALERQRSFAADASHQLRNPLTSLRLRVENLEPHLDADGARPLDAALSEVERMERLVTQLLDLAQADERDVPRANVDVAAVTRARVAHWQARCGDRFRLVTVDAGAAALVREGALDHALDVLLDNAVKFSPVDQPIDVTVAPAGPAGDRIEIRVVDQGPGMSAAECERAFERFWRGASTANIPGSGLGLSIARRLIVQSGGELQLLPGEHGGLAAVMLVPRACDGGKPAIEHAAARPPLASTAP